MNKKQVLFLGAFFGTIYFIGVFFTSPYFMLYHRYLLPLFLYTMYVFGLISMILLVCLTLTEIWKRLSDKKEAR